MWPSHLRLIRGSLRAVQVAAFAILVEQGYEMLVLGVSLAEHPLLVAAALGALGFPVPKDPA